VAGSKKYPTTLKAMSIALGEGHRFVRFFCRLLSVALACAEAQYYEQCEGTCSKNIGGSLLQTKSERSSHPHIKHLVEFGQAAASEPKKGNVVSLLPVASAVQNSTQPSLSSLLGGHQGSSPTVFLVALFILVSACIFIGLFIVMKDQKTGDRRDGSAVPANGRRGSAGPDSPASMLRSAGGISPRFATAPEPYLPAGGLSPQKPDVLPSAGAVAPGAVTHLCPSLVVPLGKECILVVPALPPMGRNTAAVVVQDLDGKSVMQAEVAMGTMTQRPLVILRAGAPPRMVGGQQQPLLAYCKAGAESGAQKGVLIYNVRDELLAQIAKDPGNSDRYVLQSGHSSMQLFFEGDLQRHAVTVTNGQGAMVAETMPAVMAFNPTGVYYKLRVVSNVDVGLMLCALLAIDCLEIS